MIGSASAVLMLGLWLALLAARAVPAVHCVLHVDARSGGHECLITQIGKDQPLESPTPGLPIAPPLLDDHVLTLSRALPDCRTDRRLEPSRGPPVPVSCQPVAG